MKTINQAHDILKDEDKRRKYDMDTKRYNQNNQANMPRVSPFQSDTFLTPFRYYRRGLNEVSSPEP